MNSRGNRTRWFKKIGTTACSSLLFFSAASAAQAAHADRLANRLNIRENQGGRAQNPRPRHNVAGSIPLQQRQDLRSVANRQQVDLTNLSNHLQHHANRLPGQVSTFRTSRPERMQRHSSFVNAAGSTRLLRGLSLDLGSTSKNITVGENLLGGNSVSISVGNNKREISAGTRVTAAEFAALNQELKTGNQGLVLTSSGAASGGSLNLNLVSDDDRTIKASQLVVPDGVSVSGDFARSADGVRINKDIVNFGSLYALSSAAGKTTAVIGARDIHNEAGALISTDLAGQGNVDLVLRADRDLTNKGTITSSGSLQLSAGRSIANSTTIEANGSINLESPQITNQGSISSGQDINLSSPAGADLSVINTGANISALNGAINIRSADYTGKDNSTVFGGNLYSKELNLFAGQGTADLTANEVTGMVNTSGSNAHVSTNTSDLILGTQCLTGDPTYYNTGNVVLAGNITAAEKLAIIAGGDITTNQTSLSIKAFNGQGFDINIIAGANVKSGSGETPANLPAQPPLSGNTTGDVTFNTNSTSGGSINFSTVTGGSFVDTRPNAANQPGGNITLAAFADSTGKKGQILLNNQWELNASGNGTGKNGNISVIAGAKQGPAIVVDKVFNNNASTAGDILIVNAQPTTSNGSAITFNTLGAITSGNIIVPSATVASLGDVTTGKLSTRGNVTVNSGRNLTLGLIEAGQTGLVKLNAFNDLSMNNIGTIANPAPTLRTQATAGGDMLVRGQIRTDGGILLVAAGDISTGSGGVSSPALESNPDGDAGNIAVIAGANFTINPTNVTVNGQAGTGGSILFTAGTPIQSLRADSNDKGDGGDVNLIAFNGQILLPANPTPFSVRANSNDNGNTGLNKNGTINIIAGADVSNAIVMGGALADGTPNNTGIINIIAAKPNANTVVLSTASEFGGISSGTFLGGATNNNSGINITRQVGVNGGNITFKAGAGGIQFADIARFGTFDVDSLGNILNHSTLDATMGGAGDQPNTLLWTAKGNISFSGRINLHSTGGTAPPVDGGGGIVMVAGGTVQSIENDLGGFSEASLETSSGQDGGNITVVAGANFTRNGNSLAITGNSGSGGSILFDNSARVGGFKAKILTHVDAHSQGGVDVNHLDGGNITLVSFNSLKLDTGGGTFISAAGSSFNVPPPVFGTNGNVTMVAGGAFTTGKIDMATNQGGSITFRMAGASPATLDVTPNSFSNFGAVTAGSFLNGALSSQVINITNVFTGGSGGVGLNIATNGNVTLGDLDVSTNVLGLDAGDIFIQSGGNVSVGNINTSNTTASGDAGDITIISKSATVFNVGGAGANKTGTLTANAGAVGDGSDIHLENQGAGGLNLVAAPTYSITSGDAGNLELDANTGTLTITTLPTINRDGKGTNKAGGAIALTGGTITAGANPINLSANATGSGKGGSILVETTTVGAGGSFNVGTGNGEYTLSATGTGGSIDLRSGGTLTIEAATTLPAEVINLESAFNNAASGVLNNININTNFFSVDAFRFVSPQSITAKTILIENQDGALTIDGGAGGVLTGTVPTAGPAGSPSTPTAINFKTPNSAALTLTGLMTLNGDATIDNLFGATTSQAGSLFTGNNNVTLNTGSWVQQGTPPQITGKNLIVNLLAGGTIINTGGSVTFNSNVTVNGINIAVVARDDIDLGSSVFNLNGGDLSLIAGYTFTTSSGGQVATNTPFTFSTPNVAGGDIVAGSATLNTKSSTGNGGDFLAVANNGTVTLGNVDTSSTTGAGGGVLIIGQNVITTGNISTFGSTDNGSVQLSVSQPQISGGPIVVTAGTLTGGSFQPGSTPTTGVVTTGTINTFTGAINIQTGESSLIDINGTLTAHDILLSTAKGTIELSTSLLTVLADGTGAGGSINVTADAFSTAGNKLTLQANGTTTGGTIDFSTDLVGKTFDSSTTNFVATGTTKGGHVSIISGADLTFGSGAIDVSGNNGGFVDVNAQNSITINGTPGAKAIIFNGKTADGGILQLSAGQSGTGSLVLNEQTFLTQANAVGNGSGGAIAFSAPIITYASTSNTAMSLTANGSGTGSGGSVAYNTDDVTQVFIGLPPASLKIKGAANFLNLSAQSGNSSGGDGGELSVVVGGNLRVNPNGLKAGPVGTGDGGDYTLVAGTTAAKGGTLIVDGSLSALANGGKNPGSITLSSSSSKAFTLNPTKTPQNGVLGTLSTGAGGGFISVNNGLGGILVSNTQALQSDNIQLEVGARGTIAQASNVQINTKFLALTANTGAIGKKALQVDAQTLAVSSNGTVNINDKSSTAVTVLPSTASAFTLTTAAPTTLNSIKASNGSILVTGGTGGSLTVAAGANLDAQNGALTLANPDTGLGTILIDTSAVVETSGKGKTTTLAIGKVPTKGTNTVAPANIKVNVTGKGQAFFGPVTGVEATGPAIVNATNKNVIFNNLSANIGTQKITLATGAVVTADPPTPSPNVAAIFPASSVDIQSASQSTNSIVDVSRFTSIDPTLVGINNTNIVTANVSGQTVLNVFRDQSLIQQTIASDNDDLMLFGGIDQNVLGDATQAGVETENELVVNALFHSESSVDGPGANVVSTGQGAPRSGKRFVLNGGSVVFAHDTATTIETTHGAVELAPHAMALMVQSDHGVAVYNLDDHRKDSVIFKTEGKRFSLSPGRHLLVTNHKVGDYAEINPVELVQHRGLSASTLKDGRKVYTSEFSIPSACFAVKPLAHLLKSNNKDDARRANHLMKTAAVIMTINPDKGDFVQFFKPRTTAFRN